MSDVAVPEGAVNQDMGFNQELRLQGGPYRTTFIGIEKVRESTPQEWEAYGDILRRVDEAKQWAIGDWLVDGKTHYGDRLYEKAAAVLGLDQSRLRNYKRTSECIPNVRRSNILQYGHHEELVTLKTMVEDANGKLYLSDETDYEKIDEMLSKAEKNKLSVRDVRDLVQKHKREQADYIRLANEPEKFSVVYADPPWSYNNSGFEMSAEQHYSVMPTDEICAMRVPVADNAVCFMWVTNPLLQDGLRVLKAWGFEYKTNIVWVKERHTAGFYVYGQHEFCLIGVRGGGMTPTDDAKAKSVIHGDNSEHSRKPDIMYEIIEAMYPGGRKLEMFARRRRDGWEAFGNEV